MIKNRKKQFLEILLVVTFTVVLCSLVSAVGVGSLYSSNIPLEIYPGETKDIMLSLQNSDVEGGITLKGSLVEGSEIATLEEGPYTVPQGGEVFAKLTVKIPENTPIGQEYNVRYRFAQVVTEETGMITLGVGITTGFKVKVVEKPPVVEQPAPPEKIGAVWIVLVIVLIVIIILVVYFLIAKAKRK